MRQQLVIYPIFTVALVSAILLLPTFFLSDTLVVFLSVLTVIKYIHRLSVLILGLVVAAVTIVWPMFVLFMIGKNSGLTPLDYVSLKNVLGFVAPTFTVIVLVMLIRRYVPGRTRSEGT